MELRYRDNGKFTILQFTDTHIGNMPFHEDDERTFDLIEKALAKFDVDLIMHTGDVIWSEGVKDADQVFKTLLSYLNKTEVPKAMTFGNHDSEEIITRTDLRAMFAEEINVQAAKKHSLVVDDLEAYTLEIMAYDSDEVANVLYVLDSGAEAPLQIGTYDWNRPEQVEWFRKVSELYRCDDQVKRNLVFQHIPIPEYWQARENIVAGNAFETNEAVSAPYLNTGMFANMYLNGEIWGIFVGHDHDNNFDGVYEGIHLVYGNVSGYQTYGDLPRGVRLIELDLPAQTITTYTVKHDEF